MGLKTKLNKCKNNSSYLKYLFDQIRIQLEIKKKNKFWIIPKYLKLDNILL